MKSLTAGKCPGMVSGVFALCLALAAHGSANVFDDAVFWFRGGKDKGNDRYMRQQGEFFDDLHANDTAHANHQMGVQSYTSPAIADGFKSNAVFRIEKVFYSALGVQKNMPVLHLSNNTIPYNGSDYFWPQYVKPYRVFADNGISNEYTVVSRLRLDEDGRKQTQCLLRIGYNGTAKKGLMLGFKPVSPGYTNKCIIALRTPNESSSNSQVTFDTINIPTNTWVDVAVVVGNGKLRIGVALPRSSEFHGNNPTIAFAEADMWTENCSLLEESKYRLFSQDGQTQQQKATGADTTCFTGSIQQMAIWGRALSDQEVMAAFGMPRPAIFRTGFDNGDSNEFGGTRSGNTQTIDGLGSWQGLWDTMHVGDIWTVNFTALSDEAGLPQIFSIKSLGDSNVADIEPKLNDTSLGVRRVAANGRTFWKIPKDLVLGGANTLVIERKAGGAGDFKMDAMELGGSLGVGKANHTISGGRVYPELIATGVPSAADPNPAHWPVGFRPYQNDNTNLQFRVWVDPDVVGFSSSSFKTCFNCYNPDNSEYTGDGSESFTIFVNGNAVTNCLAYKDWKDLDLALSPDVLSGGWNKLEIRSDDKTCHWLFDRYRFETVLRRGFSIPPPGMSIILR